VSGKGDYIHSAEGKTMTDLTDFAPGLLEDTIKDSLIVEEKRTLIKGGCTFEEARDLAIRNRTTHPRESVEWYKCENNTYVVFRVGV
jgi:hypothetical protein